MVARFVDPPEEVERLASAVIDAAFEVHTELGPGYPESVYQRALLIELELRQIAAQREARIDVAYKTRPVGYGVADFLVEERLIIELKAADEISSAHLAQARSYNKAADLHLALVINFGAEHLRNGIRRVVWTPKRFVDLEEV